MSHFFLYLNVLLCLTSVCEIQVLEDFKVFFSEFVRDGEFQEEHVLFPFVTRSKRGCNFIKPVITTRDEWNHRINYSSEEYSISYNFLSKNCISCNVVKNGSISTRYQLIFRNINKQWYLTGFMDLSVWHTDE